MGKFINNLPSWLGIVVWGNRVYVYLLTLAGLFLGWIVIKAVISKVVKRLKAWSSRTSTTLDDFVVSLFSRIVLPALYFWIFYFGLKILNLPSNLSRFVDISGIAVLTVMGVKIVVELADYGFKFYWIRRGKDVVLERSLKGMLSVIRILIWTLALVFFLDNLGFKVSSVLAGLGIGGVAVALAAQAILGDLFSYFAILFDQPFEIGDFIIIGEYLGTVEHIGIKTTRIRSLSGEQLVFSNTDLTNSRVRNYKRMDRRRVVFKLGVIYQTPLELLKQIPGVIENIIKSIPDTAFDRAHFFSYGDFSLIFEVVYYVLGADYNKYMNIQQEINFKINEEFNKRGIEFAYPTQTLFISKSG